ncbi:MAG TPA: hypothetical protein VEA37_10680 [Flavobacterium sp.]|nr:hypothetical protein [Flavobacterium sp.]
MPNIKNLFNTGNKATIIFNVIVILIALIWLIWLSKVVVKQPSVAETKQQAGIDLDHAALSTVKKYIDIYSGYEATNFSTSYENPEPFREYVK